MKTALLTISVALICAAPVSAWDDYSGRHRPNPDADIQRLQERTERMHRESQREFYEMQRQQREFEMENQLRRMEQEQRRRSWQWD